MSQDEPTVLTWRPEKEGYLQFPEGIPLLEGQRAITLHFQDGLTDIVTRKVEDGAPSIVSILRIESTKLHLSTQESLILSDLTAAYPAPIEQRCSPAELADIAVAHWARPGVVLTGNGPDQTLLPPMTEKDARAIAAYQVAERARQDCLELLPVIGYTENGNRYLRDRLCHVNGLFGTNFPVPDDDDTDLIVEVSFHDKGGSQQRMTPERGFLLSNAPSFDYDSATITGVSAATDASGAVAWHDDLEMPELLLGYLPASQVQEEDVRHYIGTALDKLSQAALDKESQPDKADETAGPS